MGKWGTIIDLFSMHFYFTHSFIMIKTHLQNIQKYDFDTNYGSVTLLSSLLHSIFIKSIHIYESLPFSQNMKNCENLFLVILVNSKTTKDFMEDTFVAKHSVCVCAVKLSALIYSFCAYKALQDWEHIKIRIVFISLNITFN